MLVEAGYIVVGQTSDVAEAVSLADAAGGAVDVAIMDGKLARGFNGVDTGELRQRWDIPSLFVSGNLEEGTRPRALQWKPLGFIGKPFSEREVRAAICSLTFC